MIASRSRKTKHSAQDHRFDLTLGHGICGVSCRICPSRCPCKQSRCPGTLLIVLREYNPFPSAHSPSRAFVSQQKLSPLGSSPPVFFEGACVWRAAPLERAGHASCFRTFLGSFCHPPGSGVGRGTSSYFLWKRWFSQYSVHERFRSTVQILNWLFWVFK